MTESPLSAARAAVYILWPSVGGGNEYGGVMCGAFNDLIKLRERSRGSDGARETRIQHMMSKI